MENEKDLEYVNQLVFAECMKEHGGSASYSTLVNLMMLGGSPDVLLFSLLINYSNYVYDSDSLLHQVLQPHFYESCVDRYKRSGMHRFEGRSLFVLQNHTLANITLTKRVLDLFKANNINQDTTGYVGMNMRIGMTPLDFLLDVRERNANLLSEEIKNGIDQEDNNYLWRIEDADLGIEILLENGAKPTPTYLLYLMKEGKDCSIIQEQIEKMS